MKKYIALFLMFACVIVLFGCDMDAKTVNIEFPFEVENVENIEMFHYAGAPASAEKKVIVSEGDIRNLYEMFEGLSLQIKEVEQTSGAEITSFRFNLSDGSTYELIYGGYGVKNGNLKSPTGNFEYFTSADIGWNWSYLNTEFEAVLVDESELPGYLDGFITTYPNASNPVIESPNNKNLSLETILKTPPALTVICGNESIETLRGTTSWQYDNGNGTFTGINSDSMHPLQAKEFMTPLNIIPTPYSHIDPLMAYLQWDVTPDKVSVRCWSEDCWGQYGDYDDTTEEIEVQKIDIEIAHGSNETQRTADYTIRLKDENYIYEVVAEWNSSDKYFGTAYYSFYTKTFYDIDLDSLTPIPIVGPEAQRTEYVMPDVIEKVHVTFYSMGQTSEWYLEDSKLSSWREWAANLSLKPLSEEKVEELQMTEGGESYHFEINDDEVSFTFIDGGTDKYLVIAKTYFEVLNGTVPDVMPEK